MQKLNVIPYPNKVEFTQGSVKKETLVGNTKLTVTPGSMGDEAYRLEITPTARRLSRQPKKARFTRAKLLNSCLTATKFPVALLRTNPLFHTAGL